MFSLSIQTSVPDFDILNNKYVQVNPYNALSPDWELQHAEEIKIRKCNDYEFETIYGQWAIYNQNAICIDKNVTMRGNWNQYDEYITPYVAIDECKNTSTKTCASREEIQDFVRGMKIGINIFRTVAQENIYKDSADFYVGD